MNRIYKKVILGVFLLMLGGTTYSQVFVGTVEQDMDPAAILQLESSTQGFKLPTYTDAAAISSSISNPAKGLMVYNLADHCLMVNKGTPLVPEWNCMKQE